MNERLERLLARYENGDISRRQLLGALAALVFAAKASAAPGPVIGNVKQINHVSIFVQDVQKSAEFYQELFGMPVLTAQPPGVNLRVGNSFLGVYPTQSLRPIGINHFCLTLENFDADRVLKQLDDHGIKGKIRLRGDTKELYFTDPDDILVQLQDVSYTGGVEPLGNRDPKQP